MLGSYVTNLFLYLRRRKLLQELETAREIMESASRHDFLTGLPNRSKFMKDLERLIACADDAMYKVKKNGKNDFAYYEKPTEE